MRIRQAMTALSLTASLAVPGLVLAAAPAQAASGCYIKASSANLRSKASTSSTSLGVAYKNNKCTEKTSTYAGGHSWYKVKMTTGNAKGVTGWVRDDLIHLPGDDVGTCIPEDTSCHTG
ncbi:MULTISPECIES: SH3 domain-containing protein [unclassified Streptomyces]|uniref:SH3 domain-containing protein n=1 Tax=unclassified Streptomyces TaxID=2593676 RepID=UPI0032525D2B